MHSCSLFNSTLLTVIWTFYLLKNQSSETKTGYSLSSRLMLGQSWGCISSSPSAFSGLVEYLKPNFTIMVWFFCHFPARQQPNVWSSGLWQTTSQSSSVCCSSASVWHTCWVVYISTASLCKCRPHRHAVVFSEDSVLSCVEVHFHLEGVPLNPMSWQRSLHHNRTTSKTDTGVSRKVNVCVLQT